MIPFSPQTDEPSQHLDALSFPLFGSRLIEASAGTGKTYTIAVLYLRLVLGHGRTPDPVNSASERTPLMPPQILVATFTQAAADELRERIRARLHEAAQIFRSDAVAADYPNADPVLLDLRADYASPQSRRAAALRLAKAADWMDEAAIFTIHGWCQRMLIEHAFHSRNLFDQNLLTGMEPLIEEATQDYWRIHIYALPDVQRQLAAQLLGDPGTLLSRVRVLLARDGTPIWLDGRPISLLDDDAAAILSRLATQNARLLAAEVAARQAWCADRDNLCALLMPLHPGLNKTSHRSLKTVADLQIALESISAWAERALPLDEKLRAFLVAPKLNKGYSRPAHPAWAAFADWQDAETHDTSAKNLAQQALWVHAALWIRSRIGTVLQAQGQMGFDDLLLNLDHALGGAEGVALANALRQQFPVALIDEFQDTDPLQFRIFDRVFGITDSAPGFTGTVVLIGDPKQSIYRFRGADIQSYLIARAATTGRHYTLTNNYRSTAGLVNAVNHVFSAAESLPHGAFGYRDADRNPVPFLKVAAKGQARWLEEQGKALPSLTGWTLPGETRAATQFVTDMAEHCATAICDQIRAGAVGQTVFHSLPSASGSSDPLQPRDIAVLVSTGTQATAIQQALNRRGVKSVYLSDRHRLFASDEAADFYLWLRAMAEPRQLARVRSALATGSFCRSLSELDAVARQDVQLDAAVERFLEYHRLWQTRGVLAAVYRLLHDYSIPARLLTNAIAGSSGERRLMNMLHLADWAQNEQAQLAGIDALVQRFQQALAANEAEHELRLEQDENLVQITTIHSSKGLQYPVVYLPFLCLIRPSEQAKKDIARIRHEGTQRVLSLGMDPVAVEAQRNDDLTEGLRLIYVALTRAESACYVGLGPVKFGGSAQGAQAETALGYLMGLSAQPDDLDAQQAMDSALGRWAACADIEITAAPPVTMDRYLAPSPSIGTALAPRPRMFRSWRISSFSGLTQTLHEIRAEPETPEQANRMDFANTERVGLSAQEDFAQAAMRAPDEAGQVHPMTEALDQLPRGAQFGTMLHQVFELAGAREFRQFTTRAPCAELLVTEPVLSTNTPAVTTTLTDLLHQVLNAPLAAPSGTIRMSDLRRYQIELEFWLPVSALDVVALDELLNAQIHPGLPRPALSAQMLAGLLNGFMYLVFEADGRFYVLDYKSNWLGATDAAYQADELIQAMLAARYDLQMALYLTALHRHLKDRLPDYDYARHMGGAFYLFVRGIATPAQGVYFQCPDAAVIEAIDA
ncbi:MAG: exodeoxyribonuclease V subunit beta, partial [Halothiobacillus sp.]|nr:exodeoxyribonuclease V subunit beta [Halothiobacillus sp.]